MQGIRSFTAQLPCTDDTSHSPMRYDRRGTAPEAAALDRSATVTMCLLAKMPYLLRVHSLAPPPPSGGIRQWGGGLARQAYSGECAAEDEALSRRPFSQQAASGETIVHVGPAATSQLSHTRHAAPWNKRATM